jgi:hypothetical protein
MCLFDRSRLFEPNPSHSRGSSDGGYMYLPPPPRGQERRTEVSMKHMKVVFALTIKTLIAEIHYDRRTHYK